MRPTFFTDDPKYRQHHGKAFEVIADNHEVFILIELETGERIYAHPFEVMEPEYA